MCSAGAACATSLPLRFGNPAGGPGARGRAWLGPVLPPWVPWGTLGSVLFLASQSPQRSRLLKAAGIPFTVVTSECDEDAIVHSDPKVLALERARAKARGAKLAGLDLAPPALVLAADTVVSLAGKPIGKPKDRADAARILGLIQGTTHHVITGHCCLLVDRSGVRLREARSLAIAQVTMKPMTAGDIAAYVATGECDGRAGAYAIQESGEKWVTGIEGAFDTIVGLHISTVAKLYWECGDQMMPGYLPRSGPGSGAHPIIRDDSPLPG